MKVKDIQEGKTYHNREQGRGKREVLAITDFDHATMHGLVKGQKVHHDEKVVQYRTNGARPKIAYSWLTSFAYWAGGEVLADVPAGTTPALLTLRLTDEVKQDASTPDGAVAYLVFTEGETDYKVLTEQSEAVATALDVVVSRGVNEPWRVYPLYAGPPITG